MVLSLRSYLQPRLHEIVSEKKSSGDALPGLSKIGQIILAGASAAFFLRAGGAGLKYLMEVLFARWLGAEEYGAFAYAYNWAQLLSVFAGLGFVTTVLRFVPEYQTEQLWARMRGLVNRSQQLVALSGGGFLVLGAGLMWVFSYDHWSTLLLGIASTIPMALINVQSSLIRGLKRIPAAFFGRYVLWPGGSIAVVFGLFQFTGEVSSRVAMGGVVLMLAGIALGQIELIRWVFPNPVWENTADYALTRKWLLVSFPLLLMSGFQIVLNRADVLMVGTLLGTTEAGLYNAGARTGRLLSFLLSAFNAIAAPMIGEHWANRDLDAIEDLMTTVIQWVFWPSLGLALGLFVFSKSILGMFGSEFPTAWPVLVLVGVGQLIHAMTGPVGYLMGLTGHEQTSAWVFGVSAGINVLLNLLLTPTFGLVGAAVATMSTVALQNLWLVLLVRARVGINIFAVWRRVLLFRS